MKRPYFKFCGAGTFIGGEYTGELMSETSGIWRWKRWHIALIADPTSPMWRAGEDTTNICTDPISYVVVNPSQKMTCWFSTLKKAKLHIIDQIKPPEVEGIEKIYDYDS